jgi:hypothetical protein
MILFLFAFLSLLTDISLASFNISLQLNSLHSHFQLMSHESTSGTATSGNIPSQITKESAIEQGSPPPGTLRLQSPLVDECFTWVNKFKSGASKKGETCFEIQSILSTSGEKSEVIKAAVESFINILDQHKFSTSSASKRGKGGERAIRESSVAVSDSSQLGNERKSRSSSIESIDTPAKKKKIEESDLPWIIRNKLFGSELRPELRTTLGLLQAWLANPKQVRASIVNTPGYPAFPDSEWLNLIQGKTINLDNVFSGFYSTSTDNQRTESIGEVEFKFGTKDSSKPVTTHGDWTIAFGLTRDAYLFTFAHRAEELKVYQRHILQQFASKRESEHLRVIALDKAIRKRVSERRDLLLSDFEQFSDLRTMHLDHFRAAESTRLSRSGTTTSSDRPPVRKRNEACHNWNKGVCRRGKNCFYLHICELCLKKGHTSDKCPSKGTTGGSGT